MRTHLVLTTLLFGRHLGGNPVADLKSISHRCYLREVAFEKELTKNNMYLPLGCLQGGVSCELRVGEWGARWHGIQHIFFFFFSITLEPTVE